eukprot:TRINITY_DN31301_c0_g1_i1.p1 TRINITY_DN31301_c0_g1~~TRINITY_DN31301_c0_g1_i1.p1  ORF type:complete len:450 (+),score=117.88 TRINITY_DN31301_c0_g1_i1:56-1351(+)
MQVARGSGQVPKPMAWVFKEPMIVMPVGTVVQAAVTTGRNRSVTPQDAETAARQIMQKKGARSKRAGTPEEAAREAQRIFAEAQRDYVVDLRASPRNVVASPSAPSSADDFRYATLQSEVALLRGELLQADQRKEYELHQAREELRNATQLLHQFTLQNAELQSRLDGQPPQTQTQPRRKPRGNTITLKEMTRLQSPRAPSQPEASALSATTLADYNRQQEVGGYEGVPVTVTQAAPPMCRQSEASNTPYTAPTQPVHYEETMSMPSPSPAKTADTASVRSSASATRARMGKQNTAIACDNDVVSLDLQSVASSRGGGGETGSVRSVRSMRSSASATKARMGKRNTAIACDNDEVSLDLGTPAATPKTAPASKPNTAIVNDNDVVDIEFSDTASRISHRSARSSASATKARIGKQNTAIACDNDEVALDNL